MHAPLRARFDQGDPLVVSAMREFAEYTDSAKDSLQRRCVAGLHELINRNFSKRQQICDLSPSHVAMVQLARGTGASAKFAGSSGAVIGTYRDDEQFAALRDAFAQIGCEVFRPLVVDKVR